MSNENQTIEEKDKQEIDKLVLALSATCSAYHFDTPEFKKKYREYIMTMGPIIDDLKKL